MSSNIWRYAMILVQLKDYNLLSSEIISTLCGDKITVSLQMRECKRLRYLYIYFLNDH